MTITTDEVNSISHLARLAIDEKDIPAYANDMTRILDLVAQLNEVDTETIAPLPHPFDAPQRLRADIVTEVDQHEKFQQLAKRVENNLYLVPKVVE